MNGSEVGCERGRIATRRHKRHKRHSGGCALFGCWGLSPHPNPLPRGEGAFAPPHPAPLDSRLRGNDELKCWEWGFFGCVALGVVVGGVGDGGPADGVEVGVEVPAGVDAGQVCVVAGDVGFEFVAVGDGC